MRGRGKSILQAFDFVAREYDSFMESTGHTRAQRRILEMLREDLEGRMLDVAAGTGIMAAAASKMTGSRVTAMDFSDEMVKKGAEKAAAEGAAVSFVRGDIEAAPFPDSLFDVVLSCLGLLWFRDKEAALEEMARLTKAAGKIILIEEDGAPRRSRVEDAAASSDVLMRFFSLIEKLETPVTLGEVEEKLGGLGFRAGRRITARIDEDHGFVGIVFQRVSPVDP
jgi:ubiquinone/menaquinone biosynthesis C-methylase UbiE